MPFERERSVGKAELLQWSSQLAEQGCTRYDDLKSGVVVLKLLGQLWPVHCNFQRKVKLRSNPKNEWDIAQNWQSVHAVLLEVGIPADLLDIRGVALGKPASSYQLLAFLYCCQNFQTHRSPAADFETPLDPRLLRFLNSPAFLRLFEPRHRRGSDRMSTPPPTQAAEPVMERPLSASQINIRPAVSPAVASHPSIEGAAVGTRSPRLPPTPPQNAPLPVLASPDRLHAERPASPAWVMSEVSFLKRHSPVGSPRPVSPSQTLASVPSPRDVVSLAAVNHLVAENHELRQQLLAMERRWTGSLSEIGTPPGAPPPPRRSSISGSGSNQHAQPLLFRMVVSLRIAWQQHARKYDDCQSKISSLLEALPPPDLSYARASLQEKALAMLRDEVIQARAHAADLLQLLEARVAKEVAGSGGWQPISAGAPAQLRQMDGGDQDSAFVARFSLAVVLCLLQLKCLPDEFEQIHNALAGLDTFEGNRLSLHSKAPSLLREVLFQRVMQSGSQCAEFLQPLLDVLISRIECLEDMRQLPGDCRAGPHAEESDADLLQQPVFSAQMEACIQAISEARLKNIDPRWTDVAQMQKDMMDLRLALHSASAEISQLREQLRKTSESRDSLLLVTSQSEETRFAVLFRYLHEAREEILRLSLRDAVWRSQGEHYQEMVSIYQSMVDDLSAAGSRDGTGAAQIVYADVLRSRKRRLEQLSKQVQGALIPQMSVLDDAHGKFIASVADVSSQVAEMTSERVRTLMQQLEHELELNRGLQSSLDDLQSRLRVSLTEPHHPYSNEQPLAALPGPLWSQSLLFDRMNGEIEALQEMIVSREMQMALYRQADERAAQQRALLSDKLQWGWTEQLRCLLGRNREPTDVAVACDPPECVECGVAVHPSATEAAVFAVPDAMEAGACAGHADFQDAAVLCLPELHSVAVSAVTVACDAVAWVQPATFETACNALPETSDCGIDPPEPCRRADAEMVTDVRVCDVHVQVVIEISEASVGQSVVVRDASADAVAEVVSRGSDSIFVVMESSSSSSSQSDPPLPSVHVSVDCRAEMIAAGVGPDSMRTADASTAPEVPVAGVEAACGTALSVASVAVEALYLEVETRDVAAAVAPEVADISVAAIADCASFGMVAQLPTEDKLTGMDALLHVDKSCGVVVAFSERGTGIAVLQVDQSAGDRLVVDDKCTDVTSSPLTELAEVACLAAPLVVDESSGDVLSRRHTSVATDLLLVVDKACSAEPGLRMDCGVGHGMEWQDAAVGVVLETSDRATGEPLLRREAPTSMDLAFAEKSSGCSPDSVEKSSDASVSVTHECVGDAVGTAEKSSGDPVLVAEKASEMVPVQVLEKSVAVAAALEDADTCADLVTCDSCVGNTLVSADKASGMIVTVSDQSCGEVLSTDEKGCGSSLQTFADQSVNSDVVSYVETAAGREDGCLAIDASMLAVAATEDAVTGSDACGASAANILDACCGPDDPQSQHLSCAVSTVSVEYMDQEVLAWPISVSAVTSTVLVEVCDACVGVSVDINGHRMADGSSQLDAGGRAAEQPAVADAALQGKPAAEYIVPGPSSDVGEDGQTATAATGLSPRFSDAATECMDIPTTASCCATDGTLSQVQQPAQESISRSAATAVSPIGRSGGPRQHLDPDESVYHDCVDSGLPLQPVLENVPLSDHRIYGFFSDDFVQRVIVSHNASRVSAADPWARWSVQL